jgi:hypothetical protein
MSGSALSAAQELLPLIEKLRFETEENRAIAEPIVDELKRTRLARLALLEENGGLQTPCVDALEVFEVLAGAEASVGWVIWNNSLPCWYSRRKYSLIRTGGTAIQPDHKAKRQSAATATAFKAAGHWSRGANKHNGPCCYVLWRTHPEHQSCSMNKPPNYVISSYARINIRL